MTAATLAWAEGKRDDARVLWDEARALIARYYRELATVEALRSGKSDFEDIFGGPRVSD